MARRTFLGRLVRRDSDSSDTRRISSKDYRPLVESLDHRLLLSTFTVNSSGDAGPGTLRDAITLTEAVAAGRLRVDGESALASLAVDAR